MLESNSRYGALTIVNTYHNGKERRATCICECGNEKDIRLNHVTKGVTVSCGCAKRKHAVELGARYGRITVVSLDYESVKGHLKVPTVCDCGAEKLIGVAELATGKTQSCGCLIVDTLVAMSTKHGGEKTALYSVWHTMKNRCLNPKADSYPGYGGRGITICSEWLSDFSEFRSWAKGNGYKVGLQIDRIDVNGDYTPSNCRWVTARVNGNNRRNNLRLTAFGETKTAAEWGRDPRCAVSGNTLAQRITKSKWPHLEAITAPPGRRLE